VVDGARRPKRGQTSIKPRRIAHHRRSSVKKGGLQLF
jgi:hypothetical protein